jgi:DNA polymerase epsilon subunit 1
MRIWALTESGQMFQVKFKVPRTIFINSRVVCNEQEFKKATKLLPRNRKVYNLYEWEKSEDVFLEKFHNLHYHHLLNHNVEGVYETKLPLLFKAVMDLGCLVKPKYSVIPRNE